MFSEKMIGHKLITKQTGASGRLCSAVRFPTWAGIESNELRLTLLVLVARCRFTCASGCTRAASFTLPS